MTEKLARYRYLYNADAFDPALRIEANERVSEMQFEHMHQRLERIETSIMRLERRLWLMVYGICTALLVQALQSFLNAGF